MTRAQWRRRATGEIPAQPIASSETVAQTPSEAADPQPMTRRRLRTGSQPVVTDAAPAVETTASAHDAPMTEPTESVDEFEAAARLFRFATATDTVTVPAAASEEPAAPETSTDVVSTAHVASGRRRQTGASFRRVAAAGFSMGAMTVAGLLAIGLTTPAQAVAAGTANETALAAPAEETTAGVAAEDIQAYVAPADVESVDLNRPEDYKAETIADIAADSGISNFSSLFTNDPDSAVQWPFAVGVTMSSGYGWRWGRMHEGIDFTPGTGAPIQAIADGVVRIATEAGGAYGVHVMIDHVIDGQVVTSHYAHMQYGSLRVSPGQHITVGTVIGSVGSTGRSTGPHLHFEILQGGTTPVDPLPWLRSHAGG